MYLIIFGWFSHFVSFFLFWIILKDFDIMDVLVAILDNAMFRVSYNA